MAPQMHAPVSMLRLKQLKERTGLGRSTLYERIRTGAWTAPVPLGPRAVGWPSHEVEALLEAQIAGADIPAVVEGLHRARKGAV
jgi:prophage regulatory protein